MATDPTGEVRHTSDGYAARITWRGGKDRRTFPLPYATDRADAKQRANVLAGMATQFRRSGIIDDPRATEIAKLAASASPATLNHVLQVARELAGGELKMVAPKSSTDPTVRDIAEKWVPLRRAEAERGDVASSTVSANAEHLEHHVLPVLGDMTVATLASEPARLRHFVTGLRDTPRTRAGAKKTRIAIEGTKLSSYRVRNICATLSKLLEDAMAEGWVQLTANPMRHAAVKLPRAETLAKGEVIFIERTAAALLLNSTLVDVELRTRCAIGVLTALDIAEISGLSFGHLDLGATVPTVRVERCFTQTGEYGPTKRPSRVRLVPLHPLVVTALRHHIARWVERFGRQPRASDPLFAAVEVQAGVRTPVPCYWHGASDDVRRSLETVGCATLRNGHPITAKSMRRSFATWLHEAGVEESVIGRLMGHAAKSVTGKHYTAADLARLYEAVCRIELPLKPPAVPSADAPGGDAGADGPAMAPSAQSDGGDSLAKVLEPNAPAPVAQGIEQRFPKPWVARSIRAGGANLRRVYELSSQWLRPPDRCGIRPSGRRRPRPFRARGPLDDAAIRTRGLGGSAGGHRMLGRSGEARPPAEPGGARCGTVGRAARPPYRALRRRPSPPAPPRHAVRQLPFEERPHGWRPVGRAW